MPLLWALFVRWGDHYSEKYGNLLIPLQNIEIIMQLHENGYWWNQGLSRWISGKSYIALRQAEVQLFHYQFAQGMELYNECEVGIYQRTKSACNSGMAAFIFLNNIQQ